MSPVPKVKGKFLTEKTGQEATVDWVGPTRQAGGRVGVRVGLQERGPEVGASLSCFPMKDVVRGGRAPRSTSSRETACIPSSLREMGCRDIPP